MLSSKVEMMTYIHRGKLFRQSLSLSNISCYHFLRNFKPLKIPSSPAFQGLWIQEGGCVQNDRATHIGCVWQCFWLICTSNHVQWVAVTRPQGWQKKPTKSSFSWDTLYMFCFRIIRELWQSFRWLAGLEKLHVCDVFSCFRNVFVCRVN